MAKRCRKCDARLSDPRRRLCAACRKPRTNRRRTDGLTTTARGYGAAHQKLRRRVAQIVASGRAKCWRCGRSIPPGARWDLGHDDADRSIYRGAECLKCNRATNARDRNAPITRHSRVW